MLDSSVSREPSTLDLYVMKVVISADQSEV